MGYPVSLHFTTILLINSGLFNKMSKCWSLFIPISSAFVEWNRNRVSLNPLWFLFEENFLLSAPEDGVKSELHIISRWVWLPASAANVHKHGCNIGKDFPVENPKTDIYSQMAVRCATPSTAGPSVWFIWVYYSTSDVMATHALGLSGFRCQHQ